MAKKAVLGSDVFYLLRHESQERVFAMKMVHGVQGKDAIVAMDGCYEILDGVCTCPGSAKGGGSRCRHLLMASGRDHYRPFQEVEWEGLRQIAERHLRPLFDTLEFKCLRESSTKGIFDALIFEGRGRKLKALEAERKVLVAFFDAGNIGVPYVKAVVLLEDFKSGEKPQTIAPPAPPPEDTLALDAYQKAVPKTHEYLGDRGDRDLIYLALGLAGEAGEVANQVKKAIRADVPGAPNAADGEVVWPSTKDRIVDELGDVLWYAANIATSLGLKLSDVAKANMVKVKAKWGKS